MHIEPGVISPVKVMAANAAASGVFMYYARLIIKNPVLLMKGLLAAVFFSVFMQVYHMPAGPSELHFLGATAIYLVLGFVPTIIGFMAGLLLQGLFFEPTDLTHLAVNSLSLVLPLITAHFALGKRLFQNIEDKISFKKILKFDALFYAGVTTMVGFWLLMGEVQTSFAAWLTFTASYIVIVALEPAVSIILITVLKRKEGSSFVQKYFELTDAK